jgi:hypothetical protein
MKKNYTRYLLLFIIASLFSQRAFSQEVSGNDFWLTFPKNWDASATICEVLLISGCSTKAYISIGGAPAGAPVIIEPGSATSVVLGVNGNLSNSAPEVPQNFGIHITSDSIISVYAINYQPFTVDGETIIPSRLLGTEYVVMQRASGNTAYPSAFTIVATQPGTNVSITNSSPVWNGATTRPAGSTWSVSLLEGQSYMVQCPLSSPSTLTGTRISSNKPIYVIGHTQCSIIQCGACDVLMDQHLPVSAWSTRYVTAQPIARNNMFASLADYLEIVAGPNPTTVTINRFSGNVSYTLPAYGNIYYLNPKAGGTDPGEANCVITANNPVGVVQYMQGSGCDGSANTDPETVSIYPESMWISEYIFSCTQTITAPNVGITIVVNAAGSPSPTTAFMLDGAPLVPTPPDTWKTIGTSTYKFCRFTLPVGVHKLTNTMNKPFAFYQYAMGSAESYTIQGGTYYTNCADVVVPIGLYGFRARQKENGILIEWKTGPNNRQKTYTLEKSINGMDYYDLATVAPSSEITDGVLSYMFTDLRPSAGLNYYRVRETAPDGEAGHSDVKVLRLEEKDLLPEVKISTGEGRLRLSYTSYRSGPVKLSIFDLQGKSITRTWQHYGEGERTVELDDVNLSEGIYTFNIVYPEGAKVFKIKL